MKKITPGPWSAPNIQGSLSGSIPVTSAALRDDPENHNDGTVAIVLRLEDARAIAALPKIISSIEEMFEADAVYSEESELSKFRMYNAWRGLRESYAAAFYSGAE